jgi:hypothetical protein
MTIQSITLTGADERTQIEELVYLSDNFPEVEIGLLYTAKPEGRRRYPSRDWLAKSARALSGRVAIHICGGGARRELLGGFLSDLTRHAPRVQVNGRLDVAEVEVLAQLVGTLITQHNDANAQLTQAVSRNHALLVDGSGGQGLSPEVWVAPETEKVVGFAGGLGPENLRGEYRRIERVAKAGAWIDMEGKLRVEDWFNLAMAHRCANLFRELKSVGDEGHECR